MGSIPHYHRRYGVSLLSSAWGQVGPPRYGRRANFCAQCAIYRISGVTCVQSVTFLVYPSFPSLRRLTRFAAQIIAYSTLNQC